MMKTFLTTVLIVFLMMPTLQAQDWGKRENPRTRYFNFNYSSQTLKSQNNESMDVSSKFGGGISYGKTYYLHSKPIVGMIRIGLDATFIDLNYGYYSPSNKEYDHYPWDDDYDYYDDDYKIEYHQAELGVQIGPSVTVTPYSKLKAHAYFRYAPTFSAIYDVEGENFSGCYASFFSSGVSISYDVIGVGVEARWGRSKFKKLGEDDYEIDWDKWERGEDISNDKFKTTSVRVYLQFRF